MADRLGMKKGSKHGLLDFTMMQAGKLLLDFTCFLNRFSAGC